MIIVIKYQIFCLCPIRVLEALCFCVVSPSISKSQMRYMTRGKPMGGICSYLAQGYCMRCIYAD